MTEEFETVEELLAWMESNYWNFLITVLVVMMDARDLKKMTEVKEYMDKMNKDKERNDRLEKARQKGIKAANNTNI